MDVISIRTGGIASIICKRIKGVKAIRLFRCTMGNSPLWHGWLPGKVGIFWPWVRFAKDIVFVVMRILATNRDNGRSNRGSGDISPALFCIYTEQPVIFVSISSIPKDIFRLLAVLIVVRCDIP